MTKKRKYIVILVGFILIALMACSLFMIQKFLNYESNQSDRISALEGRISLLEKKEKLSGNPVDRIWVGGGYNYLAIGNSITVHQETDYWWNECGMAATHPENDYFHIVSNYLKETTVDLNSYAFNFAIWETLYTDRAETIELLDYYLDGSLDLVTIQLGENVQNLDTYESDFEYLIEYILKSAPSADVIVIGDFWRKENRDEMKMEASEKCGVKYISLNSIKDNEEYQCGIGTEVFGSDGESHIVEHNGVAVHPNDKAMKYIADKIIENIRD